MIYSLVGENLDKLLILSTTDDVNREGPGVGQEPTGRQAQVKYQMLENSTKVEEDLQRHVLTYPLHLGRAPAINEMVNCWQLPTGQPFNMGYAQQILNRVELQSALLS